MKFEREPRKAAANLRKHGVAFAEAAAVFEDALSLTGADPDHSLGEHRYIIFGMSVDRRLLVCRSTSAAIQYVC